MIERKINVFVSSTFYGMHAERDELVKRIFPQLRKLCEQRGVTWGEVDLRWGITKEQRDEGKVLPICLAEIEHCRPYFISILGERYGSVNDEIPQVVIEQYEWLNEYKGKSFTELEILHGVLRNPEMAEHAFFYFRDPTYLSTIPENERIDYIEISTKDDIKKYGLKEAERRAEEKKKKLVELKKSIKNSGFPVRENYPNPKVLGELVLQDFKDVIDRLYPEGEKLDLLEQVRFEHETFAKSRFDIYIERKEYFDRLDIYVKNDDLPLVLIGDSGSGKTALLANWAKKHKENDLNETFLLVHYIGATPDSVDWQSMLRRIMGEMKLHFDIKQDIPDNPEELKMAFANWLSMVAARGRMVLVIDALNQLEDHNGALELYWLPESIPSNIRLIVSSLPGRSLDELKNRGWSTQEVKPLDVQERQTLIINYLKQYHRNLSNQMIDHIASHKQTSNPLYLRILLEEMRLYGERFTLLQRVDHYLKAPTIEVLYDKILERYEQDYDRDRKNLVRDAFSYLWAARRGLSQIELLEILGSNGEPLPGAFWSPLYLAAEKSLVNRSGLLCFSHDYLRTAVKKRYLNVESKEKEYHLHLANYFEKRELSNRKVEELPWQFARAYSWSRLAELLTNPPFFGIAWDSNRFDVKGYWVLIEDNSELSITESYKPIIKSPTLYNDQFTFGISTILFDTGHLSEALSICSILTDYHTKTGNSGSLQAYMGNQASILYLKGYLDDAMKLLLKQEKICRDLGNMDCLQASIGSQALILKARGKWDEAMKLLKEEESISRKVGNKDGIQSSLGNQALIFQLRGELGYAMRLYKEQERICKELGDKKGIHASLGGQATILFSRGDLDGAMILHKEEENICRESGNKEGLQVSLGNQALILKAKGDLDGAMKLYKEKERLCRELGKMDSLQISLGNQANILLSRGNLDGAMRLYKEKERICKELKKLDSLQICLGNQGVILRLKGDLDGAMKLHKEEERICRELSIKDSLQRSLGNQALILIAKGDLDIALELYKEKERICRELKDK